MSSKNKNMIRLRGSVQNYDWGKQGSHSLVAKLGKNGIGPEFELDEDEYYAEMWMGTHQNGPAHLYNDQAKSLSSLIETSPEHFLGETLLAKWPESRQIPFLFKILSIAKALPLQVHPDKQLAQSLHEKDPKSFVDANHKPEIAVAIGEPIEHGTWGEGVAFVGFVGFQPLERIVEHISNIQELRQAIGDDGLINQLVSRLSKDSFKELYAALLQRAQDAIAPHVRTLVERIKRGDWHNDAHSAELAPLVLAIDKQYPGDVGVFATTFFLNFVKLRRGEALYIGTDEVHAYLAGDIVECMAVSDNVLNSAFIPQEERQATNFVEALTFTPRPGDTWRLKHGEYAKSDTGHTQLYAPPLEEFVVLHTQLPIGTTETLKASHGPTIGIVTRGQALVSVGKEYEDLKAGGIIFIAPGHDIQIEPFENPQNQAEIWWASSMV